VIVELVSDAVLVADRATGILLANRAAEQLFGIERDTLLGIDIDALVSNVRQGNGSGSLDGYGHRADGSAFPIEVKLHPINDGRGTLLVAIVRPKAEPAW
jgi:PAS domain S-box-containing protein